MELTKLYAESNKSVVAIAKRIKKKGEEFPRIIGTGFIIKEDGIILTCKHIIDVIKKLPKLPSPYEKEWPITILMFQLSKNGMEVIPLDVSGVGFIEGFIPPPIYYGEETPDIGIIEVKVKSLPTISISKDYNFSVGVGKRIATLGFPMGTRTLEAPGWMHQISPTLTEGIIGSVLPFPCKNPHALLIDIISQGGSSGSPVFETETGEVIGLLYAGLKDTEVFNTVGGEIVYKVPTALTLALPSNYLDSFILKVGGKKRDSSSFPILEEYIKTKGIVKKK